MSPRQKVTGTISLLVGLLLALQGGHAVVDAALGRNGGTDTAPEFGYVVGGAFLIVALLLLSYVARLWARSRNRP